MTAINRRQALAGAATVGIGLPVLAACGADGSSTATDAAGSSSSPTSSAGGSSSAPAASGLASTSDIAVGGGTIFPDEQVVVTQPTAGEFKCFTAVCTHQGCIVSSVQAGGIRCECHDSVFSIEDGSPVNPPATEPLEEKAITVDGDQITLA